MPARTPSWWDRTFAERRAAIESALGRSHPPGAPPGYVLGFEWDDVTIRGGCCLACPPQPAGAGRAPHDNWIYVSLGLSQPPTARAAARVRRAGDEPTGDDDADSPFAYELAMIVRDAADWVAPVVRQLMWYARARLPIRPGDRMPFGFEQRPDGSLFASIGEVVGAAEHPVAGDVRGLIFWPWLGGPSTLATPTGPFTLLVGTGITGAEWEFAKAKSSEHLLLLLHRCGVGQRTDPLRRSLTADPRWAGEFRQVHGLSRRDARAGLGLSDEMPDGRSPSS